LYDFTGKIIYSNELNVSIDKMPALLILGNERLVELSSVSENQSILVKKDGSIFDSFIPGKYSMPVIGSFNANSRVVSKLVCTPDGFLSNFQMIVK
jgi:hypothetical protein